MLEVQCKHSYLQKKNLNKKIGTFTFVCVHILYEAMEKTPMVQFYFIIQFKLTSGFSETGTLINYFP